MQSGTGWIDSNRTLVFEFDNSSDRMFLKLIIGPGDSTIRERLFESAVQNHPFFRPRRRVLTGSWQTIWKRDFLDRSHLDEEIETIEDLLSVQWREFIELDLPRISERLGPAIQALSSPAAP